MYREKIYWLSETFNNCLYASTLVWPITCIISVWFAGVIARSRRKRWLPWWINSPATPPPVATASIARSGGWTDTKASTSFTRPPSTTFRMKRSRGLEFLELSTVPLTKRTCLVRRALESVTGISITPTSSPITPLSLLPPVRNFSGSTKWRWESFGAVYHSWSRSLAVRVCFVSTLSACKPFL